MIVSKLRQGLSKTKTLRATLSTKTKNQGPESYIDPLDYKRISKTARKTVSYVKQMFSLSPRFVFHLSLVLVVIFISFSGTFASKKQTGAVIANKVLSSKVQKNASFRTLATLASAVGSMSGAGSSQNIKITPEPSLATTSEDCLAKPTYSSTAISNKQREGIITYVTVPGDTLSTIATNFQISTDTVKWANNIEDENSIKDGQSLIVLPISGVLHTVAAGDTLETVAGAYSASAEMIVQQNKLKDRNLREGQQLVVPDGKKPEPPKPAEEEPANDSVAAAPQSDYTPTVRYYGGGGGNFPYGYCTWYVNSRRGAPPGAGNAWTWFGAAQAAGWATGSRPASGAIMVTWESGWGHVAYVESASGNSFTVSEMNYAGWGVVSYRTITTSSVPLIGFIY